jgi:hypothetical protein
MRRQRGADLFERCWRGLGRSRSRGDKPCTAGRQSHSLRRCTHLCCPGSRTCQHTLGMKDPAPRHICVTTSLNTIAPTSMACARSRERISCASACFSRQFEPLEHSTATDKLVALIQRKVTDVMPVEASRNSATCNQASDGAVHASKPIRNGWKECTRRGKGQPERQR